MKIGFTRIKSKIKELYDSTIGAMSIVDKGANRNAFIIQQSEAIPNYAPENSLQSRFISNLRAVFFFSSGKTTLTKDIAQSFMQSMGISTEGVVLLEDGVNFGFVDADYKEHVTRVINSDEPEDGDYRKIQSEITYNDDEIFDVLFVVQSEEKVNMKPLSNALQSESNHKEGEVDMAKQDLNLEGFKESILEGFKQSAEQNKLLQEQLTALVGVVSTLVEKKEVLQADEPVEEKQSQAQELPPFQNIQKVGIVGEPQKEVVTQSAQEKMNLARQLIQRSTI